MVDGVKWTPSNIAKNWMNVCKGLQGLPFIAQTLWQVGPMPWLMNFGSSSGWFGNGNWGNIGDTVQIGGTASKKSDGADESSMTPEERLAAKEEKAKKKAEIRQLVDNYNTMYSLLETYGKSLTDKTTPTKAVFEETLKEYKGKARTSMTKEKLEEKITDIKVLYDKYKTEIQAAKLKETKENVTSANNTQYTDKVTKLNTALSSPTETFGILTKSDSGSIEWDKDVDILEFLSCWNSNSTTKNSHIMRSIAGKYKTATGDNKSKYETLTNKLHERLATEADNIDETKLSDETKKLLEDAKTQFDKFDTMAKRFPAGEAEAGKNYSNAFDNLYRAIRLAEAEIAEKELKESFDFLGEDNPYKTTTIVSDTKADLKSEFLETARQVTNPPEPSVPQDAKEIKVDNTSYYVQTNGSTKTYYKADGTTMTKADFEAAVGEVTVNPDGSYSITKDGTTTYYKADHTDSTKEEFEAASAPEAGTGTGGTAGCVKNEHYNAGIGTGKKIYNELCSWRRGDTPDIIKNEKLFNKDTIIGIIDGFNQKSPNQNILSLMFEENFAADNCNRVVKAVMRKAHDLGLDNSSEYKALSTYFGATGEFKYNEDGTISRQDSFSFSLYTSEYIKNNTTTVYRPGTAAAIPDHIQTKTYNPDEIWAMLEPLIELIKKQDPSMTSQ